MSGVTGRVDSFVGRTSEIAAIGHAFSSGDRLITVSGPPGIGKSRLASLIVERWFPDPNAVRVFRLSDARGVDDLFAIVCSALGVDPLCRDRVVRTARALDARRGGLIVLDNFEQLVEDAATVISEWHSVATSTTFVVTSRERLRVAGERVIEVRPLSIAVGSADLESAESTCLLVARAAQIDREFDPVHGERAAVAELLRLLDGNPLAIELAAERVATLGVQAVLERMSDRFALLDRAKRDVEHRQSSLWRTIDGSWQLLDSVEQRVFAQASVFRGGFDLAAAEGVLEPPDERVRIVDVLQSLHDKSLLRVENCGEPRFDLYLVLREFAAEKLKQSGHHDVVARRHARYFVDRGGRAVNGIEQTGQPVVELREWDNLIAALEHACSSDDAAAVDLAARATLALEPLIQARGPTRAVAALIDATIGRIGDRTAQRGRLLALRADLRRHAGALSGSRADLEEAIAIARDAADCQGEGTALRRLTATATREGKRREAMRLATTARTVLSAAGDSWGEGLALRDLADLAIERGDMPRARRCLETALDLARSRRTPRLEPLVLGELALVLSEFGDTARAIACGERAVAMHQEHKDRVMEGVAQLVLGVVRMAAGDDGEVTRGHLARSHSIATETFQGRVAGAANGYLALGLLLRGELTAGRDALRDSCVTLDRSADPREAALFRGYLAAVEAVFGPTVEAEDLFARARTDLRRRTDPYVVTLDTLCAVLYAARSRDAAIRGETGAERDALTAVDDAVAAARDASTSFGETLASDTRIALRVVEKLLPYVLQSEPASLEPAAAAVKVHHLGSWVELPPGRRVSFGRRRTLRLLLVELARHRIASPGTPVPAENLIARVWRGERMRDDSAKNRLRVALSSLRDAGLRTLLRTDSGGYFFDPAIPFRLIAD